MDNNGQSNNQQTQPTEAVVTEFSTRRRTVTAALVLVAALLLGYVIYSYVVAPTTDVPVDMTPSTSEVEPGSLEAMVQRLENMGQYENNSVSSSSVDRLQDMDIVEPEGYEVDQSAVDRLRNAGGQPGFTNN